MEFFGYLFSAFIVVAVAILMMTIAVGRTKM